MKKNYTKTTGSFDLKSFLSVFLMTLLGFSLSAQVSVTCPPSVVVSTDSGACSAVYNYTYSYTGVQGSTVTYAATGSVQTWTVPAGVGSVKIETWGAQGNSNAQGVIGGAGGYATGELSVTTGDVLYIYVGDGAATTTTGGFNGGGNGGSTVNCALSAGGGGGGASDVRLNGQTLADRIIVAGGGGGAGGNRNQGCGRGSGGGGGGGYYGGGGGAGWPSASTTLPTGGSQTAGGTGGTSTYTGAPNNDGFPGVLGIGGNGGIEVGSNQGGSGIAQPGGTGGGLTGGNGLYQVNFTGQSGAGGSGYLSPMLTATSMTSGIRTGAGQVVITPFLVDTAYVSAGLASGSVFPLGVTNNTIVVSTQTSSDSCSFSVTVADSTPPSFTCPSGDTVSLGQGCTALLGDYAVSITPVDNCGGGTTESQSPGSGTVISGHGTIVPVVYTASDTLGNTGSCTINVLLVDNIRPNLTCPNNVVVTPQGFDCSQVVSWTPATAVENCGTATITSSHLPGDTFSVGATMVQYYAVDSAGNTDSCSFTVTVNTPVVDGFVTVDPLAACQGDTFTITADPGYSYTWSTGDTTASITSTSAGASLWVDLTDTSGCTGRDSVTVPQYTTLTPVITQSGSDICTGVYASYQWSENGTPIAGATSQCFTPLGNSSFTVAVVDSNGCEGVSAPFVYTNVTPGFRDAGFDLFPNPAAQLVRITMHQPLTEAGQIQLVDLAGRVVKTIAFDHLKGTQEIDLSQLNQGSYLIRVQSGDFVGHKTLIHID